MPWRPLPTRVPQAAQRVDGKQHPRADIDEQPHTAMPSTCCPAAHARWAAGFEGLRGRSSYCRRRRAIGAERQRGCARALLPFGLAEAVCSISSTPALCCS